MKICIRCNIIDDNIKFPHKSKLCGQCASKFKQCVVCKLILELNYFNKKESKCKSCEKQYRAQYRIDHKNVLKSYKNQWNIENKDKNNIYNQLYYMNNTDHIKNRNNKYRQENKHVRRKRDKIRRQNDPSFKLRNYLSRDIFRALKKNGGSKNNKSILNYLPYSIDKLKIHIENLFEPWMNWKNHGKYNPKTWDDNDPSTWTWQLDHIIPHSTFKYTNMDCQEFLDCWSLSNLRPYSAKQNILDAKRR